MVPYIKGRVTPQAHVNVPDGLFEEEYARSGFFGRYAHLYRTHAPVGWTRIEGDLKPRSYDLNKSKVGGEDYLKDRRPYLENSDCRILFGEISKPMAYYYRNADADEVLFIHKGCGKMETDFGPLTFQKGDYVVVPRGTVYRLHPQDTTQILTVESFSEIRLPDKGMIGQHALFDPAMIKTPTPDEAAVLAPPAQKEYELRIKRQDAWTSVYYPYCPIDVVGWKGDLTVWQINVDDIRPISCERYHLPPSAHTTFVAQNFVICTFLPRTLEVGDPKAMKVPFYHSNIDYDEVLFYHAGEFFSRTGVGSGMMTFHPQGIHHGPQEGAIARTQNIEKTNEIAVMIDTKFPLRVCESAVAVENNDYWRSWQKP